MGLLVMTNPQLDSSFCLETTKLTSSSSTGTIYEIGSKTTLNANKKKSGRVFVLRKEESEKRLVLEKELEFKPSFNEYLKAMDSIKTARDTQPKLMDKSSAYSTEDDLQENVKLRKFDEKGSVVSKSRDGKLKRVSTGETSNGRSSLCQRDNGVEPKLKDSHFDKGATFRNASRDSPFKRSNTTTSTDARGKLVCDQKSSKMVKASHFDKGSTFRNASRDSPFKRSNTTTSIDARRKLVCDQNSSKMVMFGTKGKNSFEREKVGVRSWGRGAHDGGTPERNLIPVQKDTNENEVEPRSRRLINSSKSFHVKSGVDSSWEVERAAFNTFEEDNDIMDKPRVSKMEMEERIQNLARRLNGADINVPEWMFSKMMRSARIRFSSHSILRVIQILGKLGNWRRVLQVIEWLQMRERYKSHRLSGDSGGRNIVVDFGC